MVSTSKRISSDETYLYNGESRVSKSCLMADLCFHHFVHFDCVPIYIFGFHHKQCASDLNNFTFVKTFQLFSSDDESSKDETRLLLPSDGSLATLNTLCSFIYYLWGNSVHIFIVRGFLKAV